ncbi:MAG: prepilin-type N-terminal cleavage/methylation domain-containing protein [Patescibacteria group bacterium]
MIKISNLKKASSFKLHDQGFTLIEAIVAIGVISVGFVGALVILSKSASQAGFLRERIIASHLAAEGIEVIKNIRDTNWLVNRDWKAGLADTPNAIVSYNSGSVIIEADSSRWCLSYGLDNGFYKYKHSYPCNTIFKRHIVLTTKTMEAYPWETDPEKLKYLEIQSIVTWQEKGQIKTIQVIDNLYNWK